MNKILIIFILLLLPNFVLAKANYTYYVSENSAITSNSETKENVAPVKLNTNYGFSNNKGYIKIKANNKKVVKISTPKLSNNSVLKLVNVVF